MLAHREMHTAATAYTTMAASEFSGVSSSGHHRSDGAHGDADDIVKQGDTCLFPMSFVSKNMAARDTSDVTATCTRSIFKDNDPREICRITDYGGKNGVRFDAYHCQSILVFEEFHSQIPISTMLNYLDIYPLTLPARYTDRTACYTKVYLTSNVPLDEQYRDIQRYQWETWKAFLRRITNIIEYLPDGSTVIHKEPGWPL